MALASQHWREEPRRLARRSALRQRQPGRIRLRLEMRMTQYMAGMETAAPTTQSVLQDVAVALSAELDLSKLVHLIVRAATQLSGAAYGSFFERTVNLVDGEEVWRLYALTGAPEEAFTRFGLPRSTKLFGPTFRAEGIVRSHDVTNDARYGSMGGMPHGHLPVRSYLAVPVVSRRGERLGALLFGHPAPNIFSDEIERSMVGFAAQAAVAIDNAKLFRDVRLSEDRFRAAVDAMQGVLWTNDPEGRMVGLQPGWAALTGQSFADYQGYGWSEAVHPDDVGPTVAEWEHSVAARVPFAFEHRVRRADGRWGDFSVRAVPVLEADGSVREWVGVHTDISVQRQAEAALRASNEEMQRYTHMVSHDLRSPLVNLMGFTAELQAMRADLVGEADDPGRAELAKDYDEALGFIRSSTERMDRLLTAILRLSREGRRRLTPVDLDLGEIVGRLLAAEQHQLTTVGAVVEVGELPRINADRAAVEQVLGNLIDNAIKYRAPRRALHLTIEARQHAGRIEITVADNGRGIAQTDHQRVFELFLRAGPQVAPGEGVGLSYVQQLVRAMGGAITLQSEPDVGSRFTVSLPLRV